MKQFLIGLDQTLNTLVKLSDGWGHPDETLSARAWRLRETHPGAARAVRIIDALFFWEENHCRDSYNSELLRSHLPRAYRRGDA